MYTLTQREAATIRPLLDAQQRIEETIKNALAVICACRELDGQQRMELTQDGGIHLAPSGEKSPDESGS